MSRSNKKFHLEKFLKQLIMVGAHIKGFSPSIKIGKNTRHSVKSRIGDFSS